MKNALWLLIISAHLGFAGMAQAIMIYDNGAAPNIAVFSDPNTPQFIADNFSLSPGSNQITEIRWTGVYASADPTGPDNFIIQLFADEAGAPSLSPFISLFVGAPGRADTGRVLFSDSVFSYSASIAPIVLPPNTTYWLSIVNDTSGQLNTDWAWAGQSFDFGGGSIGSRSGADFPWFVSSSFAQDFTLSNAQAIPEPLSIVLLVLGLPGLLRYLGAPLRHPELRSKA